MPAPPIPPASAAPLGWLVPSGADERHAFMAPHPLVLEWAAHVEAGRLATPPPSDPEVVAAREAMCRLFEHPWRRR